MLLFAAIVSERYRASHRRPIICRDFRVVISSVGASRINWCINVPAILYLSTRDLGTPTRTAQYFGTNTSVIQTMDRPVLWCTYVGISDKDRPVLWCTQVRNIAVLAMVHQLHPRSKLYQGIHETVTGTSRCFPSPVRGPHKLKKPSRER